MSRTRDLCAPLKHLVDIRHCPARWYVRRPSMQRFSAIDAKYAYSPEHASIGTVAAGEVFEVESVEGWSNYFRAPSDFTSENHAKAEAVKWAVVGPISGDLCVFVCGHSAIPCWST